MLFNSFSRRVRVGKTSPCAESRTFRRASTLLPNSAMRACVSALPAARKPAQVAAARKEYPHRHPLPCLRGGQIVDGESVAAQPLPCPRAERTQHLSACMRVFPPSRWHGGREFPRVFPFSAQKKALPGTARRQNFFWGELSLGLTGKGSRPASCSRATCFPGPPPDTRRLYGASEATFSRKIMPSGALPKRPAVCPTSCRGNPRQRRGRSTRRSTQKRGRSVPSALLPPVVRVVRAANGPLYARSFKISSTT